MSRSDESAADADPREADPREAGRLSASLSWTQADNPSGLVLRYVVPMRELMKGILGTESDADEAIKLLIVHLIASGFAGHARGPLRSFLVRGLRAAAKAQFERRPGSSGRNLSLETAKPDAVVWLRLWRAELLERSWRAVERVEHRHRERPFYRLLRAAAEEKSATPGSIALRIAAAGGTSISADVVRDLLPQARELFSRTVIAEVAQTLDRPTDREIKREIDLLTLTRFLYRE